MKEIIQSQPLYQQTYESIKAAIIKGEIKSGSKVVATKLADQFKISRTPLREALRQLTNEGLLVQDNEVGLTVVSLNEQDFEELSYCRLILEKEVIRQAIQHITTQKIHEAENYLDLSEEAYRNKVGYEVLLYNTKYHDVLIEACPNNHLKQLIERVRLMLLLYRANILHYHDYNSEVFCEHRNILQAIKDKDTEQAVTAIERHAMQDLYRGRTILNIELPKKNLKSSP